MTFENWMTQRYSSEYRKGEYRDHDMQAAFLAGINAISTPYTEGYAKGYSDGKSTRDCADCDNQLYTIGYADGVHAERERCARIAEGYDYYGTNIAAAIRRQG